MTSPFSRPGSLTITKAHLTVTADDQVRAYGATNPTLTATISGFVNGETLGTSGVTGTASVTTTAIASSGVAGSPYAITPAAGSLTAANYDFTIFTPGSLTITKAHLTVTADNQTRSYGASNPALTATISGFANGETLITAAVSGAPILSTTAIATSSVGSSPYAVTVADGGTLTATNYDFPSASFVNGQLSITKAHLTVTADDQVRAYGAINPTLPATVSGFVNGETLGTSGVTGTASVTTTAVANSGVAGSPYAITPAVGSLTAANYDFTIFTPGSLSITKAHLTVTADNQARVYGAANPTLTATISGFTNGETLGTSGITGTASVTTTAIASSGVAGSPYAITPAMGSLTAANYDFTSFIAGNLTVDPALLNITAENKSKVYGAVLPALTASYSGFVNGDTAANLTTQAMLSTTATAASGVGTYSITASGAVDANYTISYTAGTLTVDPASLNITADNKTKNYGDLFSSFTFTAVGAVNGDTFTVPMSSTGGAATAGFGSYAITIGTVTGTNLANYTLTQTNGTLTVNKIALSITADNKTKNYGDLFSAFTFTAVGAVNGDTFTVPMSSTGGAATAGFGSYAITIGTVTGTNLPNYTLTQTNGTLTVNKIALSITADNKTKNYGDLFSSFTFTAVGAVNGDTFTVPMSSTGGAATAGFGSYAISIGTITGTNLANYTLTQTNGTLTVNKIALSITADNKTKNYGDLFSAFTFTAVGAVNGDTFTVPMSSTGGAATAGFGSYAISIGTITGTNLANYTLTQTDGTLTVNKIALSITADNKTKNYGDLFSSFTFTAVGAVNGDTFTVPMSSTGGAATAGFGSYAITIGTVTGTNLANYTLTQTNGTLTVNKIALSITADNKTKNYGDLFSSFTFTAVGAVNGDTFTVPMSSTGGAATAGFGSYAISIGTITGTNLANYTLTQTNGTLTVTPASLTITANNMTKVYGAALPALTVSYSGFVNNDNSASLTTQPTLSATATATSHVSGSPYSITASGAVDANYTIKYVAGALTVTPASLTITADNKSKILNAALPTLTVAYSGLVNGDTPATFSTAPNNAPTISTTATVTSHVGNYAITASGALDTDYSISYGSGTMAITYNVCPLYDQTTPKKLGSTIPIKLQLCDVNGVTQSSSAIIIHATAVAVVGSPNDLTPDDSGNANPDNDFRYDGSQYIFNLSTKNMSVGMWQMFFIASNDPAPGIPTPGSVAASHYVSFQLK